MGRFLIALFLCLAFTVPAEAKRRVQPASIACNDRGCTDWMTNAQTASRGKAARTATRAGKVRQQVRVADNSLRRSSRGLVAPLKDKAEAILAACPGSYIMSAVRHTRVRGSGRLSLHASGRAVDMAGNPACIYRELAGWPGGVSTDYSRVRHVHFSYSPGGSEWGLRFAHWQPRKARHVRYAHAR